MNWDALGAAGELVGAVAVVVTLLYVARQIHQANVQTQASARCSFIEAYGEMNASISNSREVASIFRRGFAGEKLDKDERMQFFALVGQKDVHDDFRDAVNEVLASGETSYEMR